MNIFYIAALLTKEDITGQNLLSRDIYKSNPFSCGKKQILMPLEKWKSHVKSYFSFLGYSSKYFWDILPNLSYLFLANSTFDPLRSPHSQGHTLSHSYLKQLKWPFWSQPSSFQKSHSVALGTFYLWVHWSFQCSDHYFLADCHLHPNPVQIPSSPACILWHVISTNFLSESIPLCSSPSN